MKNLAIDAATLTISAIDLVPFGFILAEAGAAAGNLAFSAGGTFTATTATEPDALTATGADRDGTDVRITILNPGPGNAGVVLGGFDLADLTAADSGPIAA